MAPQRLVPGRLAQRVAAGFGMQGISFAVTTAAQILLVPVFLAHWGTAAYADWLVLYAAAGLLALVDCGFHATLTNTLRATQARGDAAGFARTLSAGLGAYLILTAVAFAGLLASARWVDVARLLGVEETAGAPVSFVLLGCAVLAVLPRGLVSAVFSARGALERETALYLVYSVGQSAALAAMLLAGGSPPQAAAAYLGASVLFGWGPLLFDLRRRHPDVRLRPALPGRPEMRMLASRAPYHALTAGVTAFLLQLPVLALGRWAPAPGAVVAFATMRTFTGLTRQAAIQLSVITGIEMARQQAQADHAGLERLQRGTIRLTAGALGLLTGASMVIGPPFFAAWTHGAIAFDPVLAAAFLTATVLMAPVFGAVGLLRHGDYARPLARSAAAQAVLTTALCWLLIAPLGTLGAALAAGLAEVGVVGMHGLALTARLTRVSALRVVAFAQGLVLAGVALGGGAALALGLVVPTGSLGGLLMFGALWSALVALPAPFLLLDGAQRIRVWNAARAAFAEKRPR